MKESNLKLAQKDIDEALKAVEDMENCINDGSHENYILKDFIWKSSKIRELT